MHTYWLQIARGLSSPVVLLLLSACGGGGGEGDANSSALSPLPYAGNTNAAVLTTGNAAKLVTNIFGGDTSTIDSGVAGASIVTSGNPQSESGGLTQHRGGTFRNRLARASRAASAQRSVLAASSVDDTEPCDSGSVRTTGTINDNNGTGTLTITYNDCRTGDETMRGQATFRVDAFDLGFRLPTDSTLSFARLTIRGPGVSLDFGGSSRLQRNIGNRTETQTYNVVVLDNFTREILKAENLAFVDMYDNIFFPSSFTETINGRVFDSVHGFVDITTIALLFFTTIDQPFPDSGQILLTGAPMGAGNRSILVTVLSSTLVRLALDLGA